MFKFKKNLLILIIGISLGASNLAQATCHSRDFNFPTVKVAIDEVNASSSNLMALQNTPALDSQESWSLALAGQMADRSAVVASLFQGYMPFMKN